MQHVSQRMLDNRHDLPEHELLSPAVAQAAAERGNALQPLRLRAPGRLHAKLVAFKRGEHLYADGAPDDVVFQLEQGVALSYQLSFSGRRRVLAIHTAGHLVGLNAVTALQTHARAIVPVVAAAFRRSELLKQIKRDLALASEISAHLLREAQWTDEHVIGLGLPALERVARYLLRMEARQDRTGYVHLPVGRRDVADYLGLTIETVCRVVTLLKKRGAIRLDTPNLIKVADRTKLTAAAGVDELHLPRA